MDTLIVSLQEQVKGLEEERRKIEAFKRELPLCMQLLNETIQASKERLATQMPSFLKTQPDLQVSHVKGYSSEEAAPRKRRTKDFSKDNCSVVRQSQDNVKGGNPRLTLTEVPMVGSQEENLERESVASREKTCNEIPRVVLEQLFNSASKPIVHSKPKLGGAFSPFQREKQAPQPLPQLELLHTLISSNGTIDCMGQCEGESAQADEMKKGSPKDSVDLKSKEEEGALPQKKSRRCWSPELHRRFVNALKQLGGSDVATPKQIRESMNVDGLTNDEVKSHLQKYRLHSRRSSPQVTVPTPQLVVFGGIWVPPEYAHQSPPLYNSNTHVSEVEFPPQDLYRHQGASQMPSPACYRRSLQEPCQNFSAHALTSIETGIEESMEESGGNSENSSSKTQTQAKPRDHHERGEELGDTLDSYCGSPSNLSLRC